jgi:hypothetical protein
MKSSQRRFFSLLLTCLIWQVSYGSELKITNNADKKNRNIGAEEKYGDYLSKKYEGSRHLGASGSRDVDTLGWGYGTHLT